MVGTGVVVGVGVVVGADVVVGGNVVVQLGRHDGIACVTSSFIIDADMRTPTQLPVGKALAEVPKLPLVTGTMPEFSSGLVALTNSYLLPCVTNKYVWSKSPMKSRSSVALATPKFK